MAKTKLVIEDPEYPPVLDQAELVIGHQRNESYIRGLKLRGQWQADQKEDLQVDQSKDGAAEVVRQVLEHEREMSNRPVPQAPGAREAVEVITEAYKTAAKHLGSPKEGDSATLLHMQQQHELLLEMMRQQNRGGGSHSSIDDDFGRLEKVLSLVDKVRGNSGDSGGSILNSLVSSLPGVIAAGLQLLAQRQPVPAPMQYGAAPNYAGPGAAPVANPQPEFLSAPAIPAAAGGDVGLNRIMQSGKAAIDAFTLGLTGDQFGELLERKHGEDAYLELAGLGKEFILNSLKAYPQAWAAVQSQLPQVEAFIDAFLEYGSAPADPAPGGAE